MLICIFMKKINRYTSKLSSDVYLFYNSLIIVVIVVIIIIITMGPFKNYVTL